MSYSSLRKPKNSEITMVFFASLFKSILKLLSSGDFPDDHLNFQLFFKIWLTYSLDQSFTGMIALFYRLNNSCINLYMSTYKLNKLCDTHFFRRIYTYLMSKVKRKNSVSNIMLFPVDSTVITLFLWVSLWVSLSETAHWI